MAGFVGIVVAVTVGIVVGVNLASYDHISGARRRLLVLLLVRALSQALLSVILTLSRRHGQ